MAQTTAFADPPGRAVPARRRCLRWAGRTAMAAAVAVPVVAFHDRLPDPGALWHVAAHADPLWLAVVVLGQVASMGMFARVQRRLLRAGGVRMPLPTAVRLTYAGNALSTTLPVGPAVSVAFSFRRFRHAGASPRQATAVIVLGGVIMTTAYAVVGMGALVAEPHSRVFAVAGLAGAAAVIGGTALLWTRRPALPSALARVARRAARRLLDHRLAAPVAELLDGRGALRLRPRDWGALAALSLLNWIFDIASLAAAGRAVGLHTAPYDVALAYFAAQAAGSLFPLLPGGIGAIEGSLAGSLVAFGATAVPAGAAVAVYRLVSFWGVVGAGWLAWLTIRIGENGTAGRVRARLRRLPATAGTALYASAFVTVFPPPPASPRNPTETA